MSLESFFNLFGLLFQYQSAPLIFDQVHDVFWILLKLLQKYYIFEFS